MTVPYAVQPGDCRNYWCAIAKNIAS